MSMSACFACNLHLHDIGKYICMRSHSIYTYQLIMSTDIIGLSEKDKKS